MSANGYMVRNEPDRDTKALLDFQGSFLRQRANGGELQYISCPASGLLSEETTLDPIDQFISLIAETKAQFEQNKNSAIYFTNHNCKATHKIPTILSQQNNMYGIPTCLLSVALSKNDVVGERIKNQRTGRLREDVLLGDVGLFREMYFPAELAAKLPLIWGEQKEHSQNGYDFVQIKLSPEFLNSVKQRLLHQENVRAISQTEMTSRH